MYGSILTEGQWYKFRQHSLKHSISVAYQSLLCFIWVVLDSFVQITTFIYTNILAHRHASTISNTVVCTCGSNNNRNPHLSIRTCNTFGMLNGWRLISKVISVNVWSGQQQLRCTNQIRSRCVTSSSLKWPASVCSVFVAASTLDRPKCNMPFHSLYRSACIFFWPMQALIKNLHCHSCPAFKRVRMQEFQCDSWKDVQNAIFSPIWNCRIWHSA